VGTHPANLAFRFVLEVAAFAAYVVWGHLTVDGAWGWVLGAGVGVAAFALWGTFAVLDDPSRSGRAPVPVPGWARLALEAAFFGGAVWGLVAVDQSTWAIVLGVAVVAHYALSWDRIGWLVAQR
jgi:hypothetical protein